MARTGRRRGETCTREAILSAARDAFAARGYDGASIRRIGAAAGVDPALVHYHFGTKERLFLEVLRGAVVPGHLSALLFTGEPETLGERLVTLFLELWEQDAGPSVRALVRTALTDERGARLVRDVVFPVVVDAMVRRGGLEPARARLRAALVASQLSGLALARYVLDLEPPADVPRDAVAAAVGPVLQRYLTGELPGAAGGPGPHAAERPPPRGAAS